MENEMMRQEDLQLRERDLSVIGREIKYYWMRGQAAVLDCVIEIGRRLVEAKGMIKHGEFGAWVSENFEFSHSSANTYMRLYEEYGADQLTIFGAVTDSQTFANLPYSKALQLLAIPKEEREEFAKEVGAEELSTRELKKAIDDRNRAVAEKEEAEKKNAELERRLDAAERARERAEDAAREEAKAREKVAKLEADLKKRRDSEARLKEKLREAETNPKIPDDVLTKLREEAESEARAAQGAEIEKQVEAARAEAGKGTEELMRQLEEAKAAQEAAQKDKEQAELNEKEALSALGEAQKKLKMASPSVTEFKTLFNQVQSTAQKMKALIGVIREEDADTADRLAAALKAFGGTL